MKKIIIAIDGFSSCGKSSTAKAVAGALGYSYIDTGAMYRAVTLHFLEHYVQITDPRLVSRHLDEIEIKFSFNPKSGFSETFLNGMNVEHEIRKMYISEKVSEVSALPEVRQRMVALQQKMGRKAGIVMDGRDIGTRVFPESELKIFMTALPGIRAERRQKELLEKKQMIPFDDVLRNLLERDHADMNRAESPLRKADDAIEIDTSYLTFEEQVDIIVRLALGKIYTPVV